MTEEIGIEFIWDKTDGYIPQTMGVFLYPDDGKDLLRYDVAAGYPTKIRIPKGNYRAFCLNTDIRNMDYIDFFQYESANIKCRISKSASTYIISPTDTLVSSTSMNKIDVRSSERNDKIVFRPEKISKKCTIKICNVKNIKYYTAYLSASMSTFSDAYFPGNSRFSESAATITFPISADPEENEIRGDFQFLQFNQKNGKPYLLRIFTLLSDGSQWYHTYDITDQIISSSDPTEIHIILDGLTFPKPLVNGGGFSPDVEEWEEEEEEISM